MGLFSRGSKDDRRDAPREETGAELAELGETVSEPAPQPAPEEVEPVNEERQHLNEERPEEPAPVEDELRSVEEAEETPEVHVAPIPEPPGPDESRAPDPVGPRREAEEPTEGVSEEDAEAARISFEQALSPRRPATTGVADPGVDQDAEVKRAQIISFANQKGGVAKTTTTLNLAVAFAESGHRVLCVDLDPQGNLTMSQGIDPDKVDKSMYDVLVHHIPIREVIEEREIDIAVASIDLAGAEIAMSTQIGRERSLEKALSAVSQDYDFVCIDTPPSLGLLTVNALTASDKVIVPVQCEYLSMRGLMQLQGTLEMIKENLNPRVKIEGILPTMLDSRTVHAKEAVEILEENFGELVFKSRIRKAIKFAEAPVRGSSVLKYDPKSNAADYYRELAKEVLTHGAS